MEFVPTAVCGMNKSDWPQYSIQILRPFFEDNGYHFVELGHQFRKETKGAWQNVIFGFSAYEEELVLEVTFGSRLDIIENLIAPYTYGIRGYQAESNTCITNMSKYKKEPHFRFKIKEEQDLYRMAAWVRDFFRREGFSFLDSLLDIEKLNAHFNTEPRKTCLLSFNQQLRCFRGLAIASLQQNANWEDLQKDYFAILKLYGCSEMMLERYHAFSRHLAATALN